MALSLGETEVLRDSLHVLVPDLIPGDLLTYQHTRRQYMMAGEGVRQDAYDDGKGNITVGVGFNMELPRSREDWERVFKGAVSFEAVYENRASLSLESVALLLEEALKTREQELRWIYRGVWDKLRPNERLAIESAYYNAPSLVMGPSTEKALIPAGLRISSSKQTRFYGHMKRYTEHQNEDALKQAVIELRCHSNAEKDPKIRFGLQQRRNSEAELLASYKVRRF
jgi:GH24 family phage-related lysozyme (muramidase)